MKELVCPYCKTLGVDDKGNYKCWPCEDGRILSNIWIKRMIRTWVGNNKYKKLKYGKIKYGFYNFFWHGIYKLFDRVIWRYI